MGIFNSLIRVAFCILYFTFPGPSIAQEIKLHPYKYKTLPDIPSPFKLENGTEVITGVTASGEYSVLPVTREKGDIYSCIYDFNGKGDQTWLDAPDFPPLGKTGLHSEGQLDSKIMITGRTIELINFIARPGRFSHSGFIAEDEDIISVLKGDNRIVSKMGMVHSQLAKPLFHVWNAILGNYLNWRDTSQIFYNSKKVFVILEGGKGYQESIFHDEIEGRYNIRIWRYLDNEEVKYLKSSYSDLKNGDFDSLIEKLTHLNISEMLPFYIMRYGFHEGHTDFRADPVAISIIFGLKSVIEADTIFDNDLFTLVNKHFTGRQLP